MVQGRPPKRRALTVRVPWDKAANRCSCLSYAQRLRGLMMVSAYLSCDVAVTAACSSTRELTVSFSLCSSVSPL